MLLQHNKAISWRGRSAEDGEVVWLSRGFLLLGQKVPVDCLFHIEQEKQGRDVFLTCCVSGAARMGEECIQTGKAQYSLL